MSALSFDDSGGSAVVTLNDVAEMALAHGFEKSGPQTPGKKPAQRADLQSFFNTYGVKAFSPFKEKFEKEKLLPPEEHLEKVKKVSRQC
jgi:AP-3 complex subunit delta-1